MRIFNSIVSLLLISSLMIVMGMPTLLVGWFKIDQERIAATLCVQKGDPANTCQGACHMNKVLKKVDDGSEEGTAPKRDRSEFREIQMLFEDQDEFDLSLVEEMMNGASACDILQGVTRDLFRPPIT